MATTKKISAAEASNLIELLKDRFEKNMQRHAKLQWKNVEDKLKKQTTKMASLLEMEKSGGEPDVIAYDKASDEYLFVDCALESPAARRSCCYDKAALDARKENKPKFSAQQRALEMGVELLNESDYRQMQSLGKFDTKTSSWVQTPEQIRKLGGALFCDRRFDTVFVYHNGAESYYAGRGFRTKISV